MARPVFVAVVLLAAPLRVAVRHPAPLNASVRQTASAKGIELCRNRGSPIYLWALCHPLIMTSVHCAVCPMPRAVGFAVQLSAGKLHSLQ